MAFVGMAWFRFWAWWHDSLYRMDWRAEIVRANFHVRFARGYRDSSEFQAVDFETVVTGNDKVAIKEQLAECLTDTEWR